MNPNPIQEIQKPDKSCANPTCSKQNPQPITEFYFDSVNNCYKNRCKTCLKQARKKVYDKKIPSYFYSLLNGFHRANPIHDSSITVDFLYNLFLDQKKRCKISEYYFYVPDDNDLSKYPACVRKTHPKYKLFPIISAGVGTDKDVSRNNVGLILSALKEYSDLCGGIINVKNIKKVNI